MSTQALPATTIHYERTGVGPALVFVHGMCGGAWVWPDQVARLADRFTCITYDRRGHTRSTDDAGDQRVTTHADDLAALIGVLDLHRPVLVGSSSGAHISLELLHRHRGLAAGAVLSEPPAFVLDPAAGEQLMATIEGPLGDAIRTGGERAAIPAFLDVVAPGIWERLDDDRRRRYVENTPMLFATLQAEAPLTTVGEIATIDTPVLVVAGARSVPQMSALARRLADLLPHASLLELADAGHGTYIDAADEFAASVAAFVAELDVVPAARDR